MKSSEPGQAREREMQATKNGGRRDSGGKINNNSRAVTGSRVWRLRTCVTLVPCAYDGVVTFIRFERELFERLELFGLELFDFGRKDDFCGCRAVDAVCLDRDDDVSVVFEEVVSVERNDTSLIRLSDVGKDDVDHGHEHSVLVGMTSVFDDGNDVRSLLCHVDKVTT